MGKEDPSGSFLLSCNQHVRNSICTTHINHNRSFSMITTEQMRDKIRRHRKRKSREEVSYRANSYGADRIIWMSLCAIYTQLRVEKDNKRYLTYVDMLWLLSIKQYLVESGNDKFHMREIKRFLNYSLKKNISGETMVKVAKKLQAAGYLVREGVNQQTSKWMITMKARAFYEDLYELLSI